MWLRLQRFVFLSKFDKLRLSSEAEFNGWVGPRNTHRQRTVDPSYKRL